MPKHLVPIVATVFVMLFLWLSAVPLLAWYEFSAQHQELQDAVLERDADKAVDLLKKHYAVTSEILIESGHFD